MSHSDDRTARMNALVSELLSPFSMHSACDLLELTRLDRQAEHRHVIPRAGLPNERCRESRIVTLHALITSGVHNDTLNHPGIHSSTTNSRLPVTKSNVPICKTLVSTLLRRLETASLTSTQLQSSSDPIQVESQSLEFR